MSKKDIKLIKLMGICSAVVFVIALIIGLVLIILSKKQTYKEYTFEATPAYITTTSSLEDNGSFIVKGDTEDNKLKIELTLSTQNQSMIGNYNSDSFLYRTYGGATNDVSIKFALYESDDATPVLNYLNLSFIVSTGENEASKAPLDSNNYSINGNTLTYQSQDEIFIHSLSIKFGIYI